MGSSLLRDRRGAGTLQMVILAVGIALGGLVAARALGGAASERTDCAGEQVAAFGGPVPCASDNGGGDGEARPPEAPPAPEANDAPEPEELDPAEELKQLALDILGVSDAIDCFTKGDIMACVMTALSLSPFKAIGIAIKLAKNAKRISQAVDRFLAAKRAKEKADDARKAADKAKDAAENCQGGKCTNGKCFVAGTPVHTENGWVPIEELRVGDLILSRDDETGEEAYRPIAAVMVTEDRPVLALALENSMGAVETIEATQPHPFFVEGRGWLAASELRTDDRIVSSGGGTLRVASTTGIQRRATVYNFEVEDFHTYFVGQSAAWVHNRYEDEIKDLDDRIKKLKADEAGASGKRKRELRDEQKKLREQKAELERQNKEAGDEAGDAPDNANDAKVPDDAPLKRRKPGVSGKEAADDVPEFARSQAPRVGESGKDFAKRLMDAREGPGNYPTGPGSEFNKIKKFGDRAFEDP
jgi:uncharacterized protein YdaU (DUF1376 family)